MSQFVTDIRPVHSVSEAKSARVTTNTRVAPSRANATRASSHRLAERRMTAPEALCARNRRKIRLTAARTE